MWCKPLRHKASTLGWIILKAIDAEDHQTTIFLAARYRGHWPAWICRTTNEPQFEVCEVCEANIDIPASLVFEALSLNLWYQFIGAIVSWVQRALILKHTGVLQDVMCLNPAGSTRTFYCMRIRFIWYSRAGLPKHATEVTPFREMVWWVPVLGVIVCRFDACWFSCLVSHPFISEQQHWLPAPSRQQSSSAAIASYSFRRKVKNAIIWIHLKFTLPLTFCISQILHSLLNLQIQQSTDFGIRCPWDMVSTCMCTDILLQ